MSIDVERKISARLILSILATGLMSFGGVVIETAMNVAFPSLMTEFGVSTSQVHWVTTGYLLVLALVIPASSFLKRRFATRPLFVVSVLAFVAGLVLATFAPGFGWLLAGRLLQGLGTGIALPLMFNIIIEQVPRERLGVMMGVGSLITAIAPAIGPSLGGLVVQYLGWRMLFVVLLPLIVIAFVVGVITIRQVSTPERTKFDLAGWVLLSIGFVALILGTSEASVVGWLSWQTLTLLALAVITLAAFCVRSLRREESLIRIRVFRSVPFAFSVLVVALGQFIVLALGYLLPNMAQLSWGHGALLAGSLLLPGCAIGAVIAPVSGRILDRFGARTPILLGNLLLILSTVVFAATTGWAGAALFAAVYVVLAIGQGLSIPTSMTNGLRHAPDGLETDGNAVFNTLQQLAGALGTVIATSIVASAQAADPADLAGTTLLGAQQTFVLLAVVAVLALAGSLVVFRSIRASSLPLSD